MAKGPLIILSGPSGSGKSTLLERVVQRSKLPLRLSVSATTRPPRPREIDGVHYHFWTKERFEAAKAAGEFLEWAEVHGQNYYGTLRAEVEPYNDRGVGILLDIDVQGARKVLQQFPNSVTVFLKTSSWETYEHRLRQRGTEDENAIERRLATARRELAAAHDYQHVVINDNLDSAVDQLTAIVQGSFSKE